MKNFLTKTEVFLVHLFSAYGVLWLFLSISAFFGSKDFSTKLKELWWLFGLVGLVYGFWKIWPRSKCSYKVPQRDASLSLVKKDIFSLEGSLIIPVNNQFKINQDGNLLNSKSILSQFVTKFYDEDPERLQSEINTKLATDFYSNHKESGGSYKIGTTVAVNIKGKNFYLLANTLLNSQNKSHCDQTLFETSLNELWSYLSDCASKESFIIPLIGTGHGRLTIPRDQVYREIVLSFLSSLSAKNYAEKLTICISPSDFKKHNLSFEELSSFLDAKVSYAEYTNRTSQGSNSLE